MHIHSPDHSWPFRSPHHCEFEIVTASFSTQKAYGHPPPPRSYRSDNCTLHLSQISHTQMTYCPVFLIIVTLWIIIIASMWSDLMKWFNSKFKLSTYQHYLLQYTNKRHLFINSIYDTSTFHKDFLHIFTRIFNHAITQ